MPKLPQNKIFVKLFVFLTVSFGKLRNAKVPTFILYFFVLYVFN